VGGKGRGYSTCATPAPPEAVEEPSAVRWRDSISQAMSDSWVTKYLEPVALASSGPVNSLPDVRPSHRHELQLRQPADSDFRPIAAMPWLSPTQP